MQHSPAVQSALDQALVAHGQLVTARSAPEIEAAWTDFLHKLDRVWNKAQAHFSRGPKWSRWVGPYDQKRKRDPVLRYLMQARNAKEHTIEAIVHQTQGFMTPVCDNPDGWMLINDLHIENGIVHASDIWGGHLHVQPPSIRLLPVTNRGVTYQVPTEHEGLPVAYGDARAVAAAGISFYDRFVSEAKAKFY